MVRRCCQLGFSVLELLVVLAIIMILACAAYPGYQHYWARVYRQQAAVALLKLAQGLETHFLAVHSYAGVSCQQLGADCETVKSQYRLFIKQSSVNYFLLRADAEGSQAKRDSACAWLSVDSHGVRLPKTCWR